MRTPRIKVEENGVYHCISKVIDSQYLLKAKEAKDMFTTMLYAQVKFTSMKLINLQIMDNHVHILARERPKQKLSDEELITRIRDFRGDKAANLVKCQLDTLAKQGDKASLKQAKKLRKKYLKRMFNLSRFMQELLGNFSRWLNKFLGRKGPVWQDRFKSIIVEPGSHALFCVSAYTDLNKIRAGMISDPKDDKWSGYGRALKGCDIAILGIMEAMDFWPTPAGKNVLEEYRKMMFVAGAATHEGNRDGKGRHGFDKEALEKVLKNDGRLSLKDRLLLDWKSLVGAGVLGGIDFITMIYEANPKKLGTQRVHVGRQLLKGVDSLMALRGKTESF